MIPADFPGLGFEVSAVAVKGFFSADNREYVQFVRTISPQGVIRIGGNTSDFASWSPDGNAVSLPKATVINKAAIDDLGGFLRATGWKLIWVLNVGTGTPESAADQAQAVSRSAGDRLLCFELGNEPDMFVPGGHRTRGYDYPQYHREFVHFAEVLHARLPRAPLAGPDVLASTDWVGLFAREESKNIRLLTEHYYINDASTPYATMDNLLKTDERLLKTIGQLTIDSNAVGIPYRLVEVNSFSGGGKPGVSDTFAAALWGLDLMFTVASAGAAGINFETGLNHLGFVSSYSPVFGDERASYSARPLYYALLAFRMALGGRFVDVSCNSEGVNLKAYAFRDRARQLWVALINKDLSTGAEVQIETPDGSSAAEVWPLTAPGFDSREGVTFGGSGVSPAGTWAPHRRDRLRAMAGNLTIAVPPVTAFLLQLTGQTSR